MNILKSILSILYIPVLMILGTIVGFIVGAIFIGEGIVPWWSKYEIDPEGLSVQEIMFVDYDGERSPYGGRVAKDTVYVKTIDDQIYSFSMIDESWQSVDEDFLPTSTFGAQPCYREWMYPPPVRQSIKDDVGYVSDHTLATETLCYTLLENGRLQYWYHQINVFTGLLTIGIFSVLGFVAGSVTSFLIRKRLKAKKNEVGEENENHND